MRQPKFKLGERVEGWSLGGREVFEIDEITFYGDGEIRYASKKGFRYKEEDLSLYQEPKKRKAYAWSNREGDIRYTKAEQLRTYGAMNPWERDPDYDIDYPSPE